MAKAVKRVRVTSNQLAQARSNAKKDNTPVWLDCESWSAEQFTAKFREAMHYYALNFSGVDLKPAVIKWLHSIGATLDDINAFKKTKDWRSSPTMGAIASLLLHGMQPQRDDFNNGRDSAKWLLAQVTKTIEDGKNDSQLSSDSEDETAPKKTITIQSRVKDAAVWMAKDIDIALEDFFTSPATFVATSYQPLTMLKSKGARAAHARLIKGFYQPCLTELLELASGDADEQLREGYNHYSKRQIRGFISFLQSVQAACDVIIEQTTPVRKPAVKRAIPKAQLVANLKYKQSDDTLNLVSIDPVAIIGAKELWVFNSKLKKIGRFVAQDSLKLSVKGTTIVNADPIKSVQKSLRSAIQQLSTIKNKTRAEFSAFFESIPTLDTKLSSRLNEEIVLLKAIS